MTLLVKRNVETVQTRSYWLGWPVFALLHIPLGLAMHSYALVANIHAYLTLAVAAYIALSTRDMRKAAWVAAYICGAEILWRMTDVSIFYEIGKYAIVAVLGLCLLRLPIKQSIAMPVGYFLLLTLSIPLTVNGLSLGLARDQISFNLSGPLCLAVAVMFFTQFRLPVQDYYPLTWVLVGPIIGIGASAAFNTATAEAINFTGESNYVTSGGFGPNQVSAILSLGTVMLLMLAIQYRRDRLIALITALGLLTISVLTFSRGGLYNVGVSIIAAGIFLMGNARLRRSFLIVLVPAVLIGSYWIYPRLEEFTSGMVTKRFTDTNPTLRFEIMMAEWHTFTRNPLLGTGPGMGRFERYGELGYWVSSHTEYTRMIAEHGIPGIFAIVLLLLMASRALRRTPPGIQQVWCAALLAWSCTEMAHAAMRIAAVAFIFGLAMAGFNNHENNEEQNANQRHFIR
ncbi:MAG TPA: O-antigen ligase family protein [Anaerolineaceae bacterium]